MAPEKKEDIVCAFHEDLEKKLTEINSWMGKIDGKLEELLLWRAGVKGAAAVISVIVSAIMTVGIFIVKSVLFPGKVQ